jgi:hypothetical protein
MPRADRFAIFSRLNERRSISSDAFCCARALSFLNLSLDRLDRLRWRVKLQKSQAADTAKPLTVTAAAL